jgi:multidrug efflux pump subunit AcrA (membrane-fusion protein)
LDTVLVQIGQRVHAGEPLARLYSAELAGLQRSYLLAKSASGLASGRVARDQSLFDEGIIAESRLRESQAAFQMARATEQEQRRLLSLAGYTAPTIESLRPETISTSVTLRAPEDGIVLDQAVPVGQHVEPGATLFRLASAGDWWLELEAAGSQVREIQVGDSVRVSGCRVDGRVIAVGSQLRAASQTIPVRAVMPEAGTCLSPNQFLEASVLRNATSANLVRVPAAALIRNSDREYLFIQRATGFQPVPVTVERREGENVLLRPGGAIEPGIKVAVGGLFVLKGAWLGLGAPGAAEGQH